jgi:hypothetical protein
MPAWKHLRTSLLVIGAAVSCKDVCVAQLPDPSSRFTYTETIISPEKARELSQAHTTLTLSRLESLSADVAAALAEPRHGQENEMMELTLSAVREMSVDAAAALAKHSGRISLPAVEILSADAAAALFGEGGKSLELDGLHDVSPEVARAMAGCRRSSLGIGISVLSPDIAAILAKRRRHLSFPNLKSLSVDSAEAFQAHDGPLDWLIFGKTFITPQVADTLLGHEGGLAFSVDRLEPGVGDILARHKSMVGVALVEIDSVALARKMFSEDTASSSLRRLRTMSPEIAAEYVRWQPGYLSSLDTLSVEAAKELAKDTHDINLPAITKLSPELALALTDRKPAVYLGGLKSLDGPDAVAVAEAMASTSAPVYIDYLERVSAPALAALRKKATIKIPPDEKLTIVP